MSSNRLRGSKRLQVIQNWLNGKDDENWEVFPSKTEGKYIVRPRKSEIKIKTEPEEEHREQEKEQEHEEEQIIEPPKPRSQPQTFDPTINIEILNQLKLLGEEIRVKREKKEQKKMIKHVVQKQISKQNYFKPNIEQEEIQPSPHEEQQQSIPTRRRNNIFADMN